MLLPRSSRAAISAAICLASTLGISHRAAAEEPITVTKASIGFGGKYKSGFWAPVQLSLVGGPQGAKGQLELVIPDGDQVPVIFSHESRSAVDLGPNEEATLLLYGKIGPIAAPIAVQLRNDNGVIWSQSLSGLTAPPLRPTQELVVGIGPPVGLEVAQAAIKRQPDIALITAQVESPADLPDQWWGYEGVETVVLATSDQATIEQFSDPQREALIQWVRLGGRLVLCIGANGEQLLAADSPWAALVPGKLSDVSPLRDGSGLESFTASKLPIDQDLFQRNRPAVTRLTVATGKVLVEEGGAIAASRPLIVHAPHALGQVVFVGLDPDHPSLANWNGRENLLVRLLAGEDGQREFSGGESRRGVTHLGYDDLVGQLRAGLDQFPGVTMVNFTTVSVLTIVYLLLVGPGDYLLLARLGWQRHWTWITFPLIVAALGAVAWLFGGQSHGQRVRINQAEIVDIDATQGVVRGTAWVHLYSPATDHFDVQMRIEAPLGFNSANAEEANNRAGWLSWQGLPGESLGGLGSRQVALSTAEPYRAGQPGSQPRLQGLPVQVASSKSLAGRWWGEAKITAEAKLGVNDYGILTGEFRSPLPIELSDCILVHGEKLYRLGAVRPRQLLHMDAFTPLNLEARLTQRTVVQFKDVSTPWRQDSTDVQRILLMMMFHEAARGRAYTGLTNRYQPSIDLTGHVRLGRAVLAGRAPAGTCQLRRGDQPLADEADVRTWTWYRVILPVGQEQSETSPP